MYLPVRRPFDLSPNLANLLAITVLFLVRNKPVDPPHELQAALKPLTVFLFQGSKLILLPSMNNPAFNCWEPAKNL